MLSDKFTKNKISTTDDKSLFLGLRRIAETPILFIGISNENTTVKSGW